MARGEERHAISSGPKGSGVTLEEGASGKKVKVSQVTRKREKEQKI